MAAAAAPRGEPLRAASPGAAAVLQLALAEIEDARKALARALERPAES
jgi:hypothetical protein